jgi:hypothetical protein
VNSIVSEAGNQGKTKTYCWYCGGLVDCELDGLNKHKWDVRNVEAFSVISVVDDGSVSIQEIATKNELG